MEEKKVPEDELLNDLFADEEAEITELPFPTLKHYRAGRVVEEYLSPEKYRAIVLEKLYPFQPVPKLNRLMVEIHENRAFHVRDYKVLKGADMLWLVSPYYFSSGGTVIDWVPASSAGKYAPPLEGLPRRRHSTRHQE